MEEDNIKRMFSTYYEMAKKCAEEGIKRLKDNDQSSFLEKLDAAVRQVSNIETETRRESQALDGIEKDINEAEDINELGDLNKMLEEKLKQCTTSVTWTGGLQEYQAHVKNVFDSLELDDMIVASSESNIDPYSKKPIQHPVRTMYCNHVFDKTSVMELLSAKGRHGKLRCPYMGCNKHFSAKELVDVSEDNESD